MRRHHHVARLAKRALHKAAHLLMRHHAAARDVRFQRRERVGKPRNRRPNRGEPRGLRRLKNAPQRPHLDLVLAARVIRQKRPQRVARLTAVMSREVRQKPLRRLLLAVAPREMMLKARLRLRPAALHEDVHVVVQILVVDDGLEGRHQRAHRSNHVFLLMHSF